MLVVNLPKIKKELKSLCKLKIQILFIKSEPDKARFQHDIAYEKSKDFVKIRQSDKVLKEKAFKIGNPKYDGYQRRLASMVYKFFDKKSKGSGINEPNYQLANELYKLIIRKLKKKQKFIDHIEIIFGVLI